MPRERLHPRISINTLSLAPAPLDSQANLVARIGAHAICPEIAQVEAFGIDATARCLRNTGLAVAAVTHRAFGFATPEQAREAQGRLFHSIALASALGAPAIVMTTGGRGALTWPEAATRFAEAIAPCAQAARQAGIRLGIEPTSHLYADASIAHRLCDAAQLARIAGIHVIPDLFACWADADIAAAIAEAGPLIAFVQVSDYVHGDRALPCRAVPGDGAAALDRLIPAIAATGYAGFYDLEIIGPRLQAEGREQGLARGAAYITALLEGTPA